MKKVSTDTLTELFYCETYKDTDQVVKPHLKPRGAHVTGPYRTYAAAQQHGIQSPCSHFTVSKAFTNLAPENIPFVDDRESKSDAGN